ncbi:hypothetical protein [Desulfobacter latus]|uniref:Uncharacterized protein n=1 Tax=Desulfobacter latus TaxID=2292 RepID=A0A850SZD3_9BACT|nr:hypothetical protein [Desulfobacter latus]NWH04121.1 hypothetical protein [Desulfobacter latus]
MARTIKQNIIPKEQAVFRMDKDGAWHNEHGKLEHPKIINYFNQSIQKDDQGYFLCQTINMETDAHLIKFTQKALARMTSFLKETPQGLVLNVGRTQTLIREK